MQGTYEYIQKSKNNNQGKVLFLTPLIFGCAVLSTWNSGLIFASLAVLHTFIIHLVDVFFGKPFLHHCLLQIRKRI